MKHIFPAIAVLAFFGCAEKQESKKQNAESAKPAEVAKAAVSATPTAAPSPAPEKKKAIDTIAPKTAEACCDDDLKTTADAPPEKKIELQSVKLKQLLAKVAEQKGKIVIIDLWATFCKPCMKEFPNLIRMHHTYGGKGVVCMSLTIDDADEKADALKFLQKEKAVISNFWLNEPTEVVQKHWNFEAVPACVVYGRDGKIAKVFIRSSTETFDYKDVEKLVKGMLGEKKASAKIDLAPVTMKDLLGKHVPAHKGKVVVLDVWGTFCPPCVREFPKLVELHKNYKDKGVVCVAMSLNDEEELPMARAFLEKHEAHFTNFWLPEGFKGAREVWKFQAIPVVVVFDRDGRVANIFRDSKFTYDDVEKLVKKLI